MVKNHKLARAISDIGLEMDRDLNAAINLEKLFYLNKKVRPVRLKLTPVEITAMPKSVFPTKATSIVKSGSKLQAG